MQLFFNICINNNMKRKAMRSIQISICLTIYLLTMSFTYCYGQWSLYSEYGLAGYYVEVEEGAKSNGFQSDRKMLPSVGISVTRELFKPKEHFELLGGIGLSYTRDYYGQYWYYRSIGQDEKAYYISDERDYKYVNLTLSV